MVPQPLVKSGVKAQDLSGEIAKILGGGAGGGKDGRVSQGMGTEASKFDEAVDAATKLVSELKL